MEGPQGLDVTPSSSGAPLRLADFATVVEALDYAAEGAAGLNLHTPQAALAEALTYADLRRQALALAGGLLGAGLRPGERVAVLAETDGDFVRTFFACQYAGLAPAPLPLPAAFGGRAAYVEQLAGMLRRADVSAALGPAEFTPWLIEAAAELPLRFVGALGDLREEPSFEPAPRRPEELAYVQFSSGSTRFPQGIAVTQAALMANARAVGRHGLKVREGDRATSWLPFYHDMGLVGFLLIPLCCQLSVDLLPTRAFVRRPLLWPELISRNGGTLSYSPSFGYELTARRAATGTPAGLDLGGWRVAGIGGDMVRPHVLEAFAERFASAGFRREAFVASYGMAEATLALSSAPLDRGLRTDSVDLALLQREGVAEAAGEGSARAFVLNGPALPGHAIEARDEHGLALPERRVGRLFARGPSLMQGYLGEAGETATVLSDEGWLDTGDLGYLLDGEVVVTGRAKDLVIVNGRNIWPQDLEWSAETEVDGLRSGDVAVFSVDGEQEERVVALVQARSRDPETRLALQEAVTNHLRARHGVAVQVTLVGAHALPMTSSGKLSRSRARQAWLDGAFGAAAHAG